MEKKTMSTKNILFTSDSNSQMKYKISRKELIQHIKTQLLCTLGSMRDDTDEEITELSQILGFPSLEAMLQSEEFEDVVACDFTENALGGGVRRTEKVFCYRVIPTERIAHITKNICDAAFEKERLAMQRDYKERSQLGNPLYTAKIMEGKMRLLTCVAKLNGEIEPVSVFDLQKEYYAIYQVFLDKLELRRWFGKKHIKQVFDVFCFNDVEVSTDVERNGSLYILLRRPFIEIREECKRIAQDGSLFVREAPNNFNQAVLDPPNVVEKHKPTLVPLNSKNENFFTNDRLLARKFGGMDNRNSSFSSQSPADAAAIASKFQINQDYPRSNTFTQSDYETLGEKPNNRDAEIIPGLSNGNSLPETFLPSKPRKINPNGVENTRIEESKEQAVQEIFNSGSTARNKKEWSSNVTPLKKDPLRYTSRGQGTYTDNESSDDEQMSANNRLILSQFPSRSRAADFRAIRTTEKPISNGWENSSRSQWPDQSSLSNAGDNLVEITDDDPPSAYSNAHAEKYMKKAADYQAESKARFMAERIAERQKKKYDAQKARLNQQLQNQGYSSSTGGTSSRFTNFCVTENTSEYKPRVVNEGDSFGIQELSHNAAADAKKDIWETDHNNKTQNSQSPEQPIFTFGQVKRAPQATIKQVINDFGETQLCAAGNGVDSYKNSYASQLPDEVRILAAHISSILMTRQSISVSQLDDLITLIYGRKLHPKQGAFVEESWPAFVSKYCGKNVNVIFSASNSILVWKEQVGDEMRNAMIQLGLQCEASSSNVHLNPVCSNGF